MFGDSLCKVNICHVLPDVHCVLIGNPPQTLFYFSVCIIVYVDYSLNLR